MGARRGPLVATALVAPAPLALALLALVAACQRRFDPGITRTESAELPREARDPTDLASCARCHAEAARTWEASAHHRSASDPLYEEAVALEPLAFCRGCHAPSADPSRPTPPEARARGIGCTDCHTNTKEHAAVPASPVGTKTCATCHEFAFPDGTPGMQRTASEHAASAYAEVACTSCHMPGGPPPGPGQPGGPPPGPGQPGGDHGFAVTDAMVRRAVVVEVTRRGRAAVAVKLSPGRVGHAFPTGDLFRRVVVEAELLDERGTVHARRRRDLARTFLPTGQPAPGGRVELVDERIGAGLQPFELDFAPLRAIAKPRVHVEIAFERVAHPLGARPERAEVASRVLLFEGDVDLAP